MASFASHQPPVCSAGYASFPFPCSIAPPSPHPKTHGIVFEKSRCLERIICGRFDSTQQNPNQCCCVNVKFFDLFVGHTYTFGRGRTISLSVREVLASSREPHNDFRLSNIFQSIE
jgi:hypothetical protein